MFESKTLLIEVGCEELPPKALEVISHAFTEGICEGLKKLGVHANIAHAKTYNSPRRLAVLIPEVASSQSDQVQERRGPALNAGLDSE